MAKILDLFLNYTSDFKQSFEIINLSHSHDYYKNTCFKDFTIVRQYEGKKEKKQQKKWQQF